MVLKKRQHIDCYVQQQRFTEITLFIYFTNLTPIFSTLTDWELPIIIIHSLSINIIFCSRVCERTERSVSGVYSINNCSVVGMKYEYFYLSTDVIDDTRMNDKQAFSHCRRRYHKQLDVRLYSLSNAAAAAVVVEKLRVRQIERDRGRIKEEEEERGKAVGKYYAKNNSSTFSCQTPRHR